MKKVRIFWALIPALFFSVALSSCSSEEYDYRDGSHISEDYVAFGSSYDNEVYGHDRVVTDFTIHEIVDRYSGEALWTDEVIRNTDEIVITRESVKFKGSEETESPSFVSVYYTNAGQLRRLSIFSGQTGNHEQRFGRYRVSVSADLLSVYEDENLIYSKQGRL